MHEYMTAHKSLQTKPDKSATAAAERWNSEAAGTDAWIVCFKLRLSATNGVWAVEKRADGAEG